jgi:hypothetical protein
MCELPNGREPICLVHYTSVQALSNYLVNKSDLGDCEVRGKG